MCLVEGGIDMANRWRLTLASVVAMADRMTFKRFLDRTLIKQIRL